MAIFDDVFKLLNPREILKKVDEPNNTARGQYALPCSVVRSYQEFQDTCFDYLEHHMQATLGVSLNPIHLMSKMNTYLRGDDGIQNAAYLAMSGADGGMNKVLDMLCQGFVQEQKQSYFNYVLNNYIDPLSFEDKLDFMTEFKDKLGGYAPGPFQFVHPAAMVDDYRSVIWNYIESITNYRNIWQY